MTVDGHVVRPSVGEEGSGSQSEQVLPQDSGEQHSGNFAQWKCQGRRSLAVVSSCCPEWPRPSPGRSAPGFS